MAEWLYTPSRPRNLAGTMNINQISLNIALLSDPPLPFSVFYQQLTSSTNTAVWRFTLQGNELGRVQSNPGYNFIAGMTILQIFKRHI